jgi:hypothetical protein
MSELMFFASSAQVEVGVRLPWGSAGGDAWDRVAETFLDVALGGRGVWIATIAQPANLDWTSIIGSYTGDARDLALKCSGRLNAEFGYIASFDKRVAREIVGSSDFQWDGAFLFPRAREELDAVIATLEKIDVRSETFDGMGEFIYSTGDGIGLRWLHPHPASDIERIKRACLEQGFTLASFDSSEPNELT